MTENVDRVMEAQMKYYDLGSGVCFNQQLHEVKFKRLEDAQAFKAAYLEYIVIYLEVTK